jgi:type II secretory pathway pseudopilin PulG
MLAAIHAPFGPMKRKLSHGTSSAGFTLLEIVIALSVFVLIIGGVFGIAHGTLELSNDITLTQERSLIRQNFIEFLRTSFRRLPAEAELVLGRPSSGGTGAVSITIFNGGDAFSPGPAIPPEGSVELYSKEMPGGDFTVGLRMLDGDQTQALRTNTGRSLRRASGKETILPLVEDVQRFNWEFYDASRAEWVGKWEGAARPMFARVELALDDGIPTVYVFWIPPILRSPVSGAMQPQLGPDGRPLPPAAPGIPTVPGQPQITNPNVTPPPVR